MIWFKRILKKIRVKPFLLGFVSLLWYLLRTGTKPSRANYPCQKVAAANINLWFITYILPVITLVQNKWKKPFVVLCALLFVFILVNPAYQYRIKMLWGQSEYDIIIEEQTAYLGPSSDIYVVRDTDGTDDGVNRLTDLMGSHGFKFYKSQEEGRNKGPYGIVGSDDVVLIKINSQWDQRGGTNTDLVKSLIETITSHPDTFTGEVVIVDNGQAQHGSLPEGGGSFDWELNNAQDQSQSITDVVNTFQSHKVSIYNWQDITEDPIVNEFSVGDHNDGYVLTDKKYAGSSSTYVTYPKFTTLHGSKISFKHGIWDDDSTSYSNEKLVLLNVPVLKSHISYGVTGCVKHYMGVHSEKTSSAHGYIDDGAMGTLFINTRMPDLNILDCIYVNARPKNGPPTSYSRATKLDIIVAGKDPVAIDYWASKAILMQTAELLGYPASDIDYLDPDTIIHEDWQHSACWLTEVCTILNTGGIETVVDNSQINVYLYQGEKCQLNLVTGWNLVGINGNPVDSDIDTMFSGNIDKINGIYYYDTQSQKFEMWINGMSGLQTLTKLESGCGYWINVKESFSSEVYINGYSESALYHGWNLIGLAGDSPESPESYLDDTGWSKLVGYDRVNDEWIYHFPDTGGDIDLLVPGNGYWVEII